MATVTNAAETGSEKPKRKNKPGPGRPPNDQVEPLREAKQNRFFEIVANTPAEDWGTRVSLWLYRLEPYTDRRRSGDHIYLMQYTSPVDEQRVMADFGSGRYRLMLTFRKPNGEGNDQRDRYEFEINNPAYPPKIPAGEWVDDVRNNKWAWAKPMLQTVNGNGTTPQPAAAQPDMLTTLDTLDRIQDRATERMKAAIPSSDAKPAADPIDQAVKIMTLMKGGGETVLLQMMADQLKASQARNERLEDELRGSIKNLTPTVIPDPLEALDKQAAMFERFKKLFGKEDEGLVEGAIRRSKMPWVAEFFMPMLPEAMKVLQPIAGALAAKMMQPPQQHPPTAPPAPHTIPPPQAQPPQGTTGQPQQPPPEHNETVRFMIDMAPRVVKHIHEDAPGDVFAQWIVDGYGVERVNTIRQASPEQIVMFYRTLPSWELLKDREAQLLQFWKEFHEWKPEELSDGMEEDAKEKVG
jgi:hypothetical protein